MSEIWVNRARGAHTGGGGKNNIMRIGRGRKGEPIEKLRQCIRRGPAFSCLIYCSEQPYEGDNSVLMLQVRKLRLSAAP